MQKPVKIVFVGDAKTGKTRMCSKLLRSGKGANSPYTPTMGAEVYKYVNQNGAEIEIWDCGGDKRYVGLRDAYYIDADICVVFGYNQYDWVRDVERVSENVIVHVFHNLYVLRNLFESISNGSPKGHVTDNEITVINVLNTTTV